MNDEFQSNKKTYRVYITLDNGLGETKSLDPENIIMFSYSNEMNRLYTIGYLDYDDTNAIVDKFIESQYATCKVDFQKILKQQDGQAVKITSENTIKLDFVINNVEITENVPGRIRYRLHLIGNTYLNLNRNITYTTYGDQMQFPTDIIMEILKNQAKLGVNGDSFENCKSTNKINYISDENDDSFSSIKFLLNRSCYFDKQTDTSIKALVLNECTNTVFLYDTGAKGSKLGILRAPIEIRVFKGMMETDNDIPVGIGYVSRKEKLDSLLNTKTMNYFYYDIDNNSIGSYQMTEDKMKHVFSGNENSSGKMFKTLGDGFRRSEKQWNNDIDVYQNMFEAIMQSNGLVVNQYGEIGTIPGFTCQVNIPSAFPTENPFSATVNSYMKDKLKYQSFTGSWDIFKVEHFISPKKELFRQKLVLYRNNV